MSYFWLISAPAEPTVDATWNTLQRKTAKEQNLSLNYRFGTPSLRVGTLDSLMSLSDELTKVDMQVEACVRKIERQLNDLQQKNERPLVDRKPAESFVTQFQWDAAKYPTNASVKDLVDQIIEEINVLEEEIKVKSSEYHQTKSSLHAMEKKQTGSLLTKTLDTLVKPEDFVESEHLTTLLVVVPRFSIDQWLTTYESLTQFIVPRSSKKVAEDGEYAMFTVTLFRRVVDNFKNACREARFTVRDFSYDAGVIASNEASRKSLKSGAEKQWVCTAQRALVPHLCYSCLCLCVYRYL
eukprot:TRINITY_DN93_c0_g3_i1.p1 TRINITY_DN93_c0_g3~~TRINITY_DN93_c0_g3_i1.p1  ORF type:complete len:296 (-),score=52.76 TRINITY_DN93_c0_g3_i1:314-1201(-)